MNKRVFIAGGGVLLLALCAILLSLSMSAKKDRVRLSADLKEMVLLRQEFLDLKARVDAVEAKKGLSKVEGIVQAVDEVFRSMGLAQKLKSVKSVGTSEKPWTIEEEAEVQVEKVNMNELTNILYKMENAQMILSIKKATLKTTFDNPSLLNMSMTVALVRPR